jgi:hypothetical protein
MKYIALVIVGLFLIFGFAHAHLVEPDTFEFETQLGKMQLAENNPNVATFHTFKPMTKGKKEPYGPEH